MALAPGTKLGPYEILAPLGAGGMGEVHRARDTRLGREVAIKVLPPAFAEAPERLRRFRREAQILASLNHPNIAAIYGLEESEGVVALVMELVPGEDLADRLRRGPILAEEALAIARQITEALEEAHEKGIVHRDLKPANVKLTPDGKVKVLDFGLAKAFEGDDATSGPNELSLSPTMSRQMTEAGMILGTAAYMSPEQARGKSVDRRTDIWAFGVVLFEMLSGRRLFAGETVSDVLAAVLKTDPDWNLLPANLPPAVRRLLRRCLDRDPRTRLRDVGEARIALVSSEPDAYPDERPRRVWRPAFLAAAALAAGILLGGGALSWRQVRRVATPGVAPAPVRALIELPADAPLAIGGDIPSVGYNSPVLALSPDGSLLAYVAKTATSQMLYVIDTSSGSATARPGTEGAIHPFFSPDGQWIGFLTADRVKKVSSRGGEVISLCPARTPVLASWAAPHALYFTEDETGTLSRVSAEGGAPERLLSLAKEVGSVAGRRLISDVLPGGQVAVATSGNGISCDHADIVLVNTSTHEQKSVLRNGYAARYVAPGYLLFARAGNLMAVPFDLAQQRVSGREMPLARGVAMESLFGQLHASSSSTGLAAYVPGGDMSVGRLARIPSVGLGGPAEFLDMPERVYGVVSLRPDGRRLAAHVGDVEDSIWIYDIEGQEGYKLAGSDGEGFPLWSPDGRKLATGRAGVGVIIRDADESRALGESVQVEAAALKANSLRPNTWSPGGDVLAFRAGPPFRLHFAGPGKPANTKDVDVIFPRFSPDGRWLAFVSDRTGTHEIVLCSYPEGQELGRPVSLDGGFEPLWMPNGDLFYRKANRWFVTRVTTSPRPDWKAARLVFSTDFIDTPGMSYDVFPDGQHMLVVKRVRPVERTKIAIVANWTSGMPR